MGIAVDIPPRLVRMVVWEAKDRNRSFEKHEGWDNDAKKWGVDPEDRNIVGLMGEMAFAIHADLEIDTEIVKWSDGGCDFDVTVDGIRRSVDVKTSQKEPYALFVKTYQVDADYYVLGHLEDRTVTFLGAASRDMVLEAQRQGSEYGYDNYTIPIEDLDPVPRAEEVVQVG